MQYHLWLLLPSQDLYYLPTGAPTLTHILTHAGTQNAIAHECGTAHLEATSGSGHLGAQKELPWKQLRSWQSLCTWHVMMGSRWANSHHRECEKQLCTEQLFTPISKTLFYKCHFIHVNRVFASVCFQSLNSSSSPDGNVWACSNQAGICRGCSPWPSHFTRRS